MIRTPYTPTHTPTTTRHPPKKSSIEAKGLIKEGQKGLTDVLAITNAHGHLVRRGRVGAGLAGDQWRAEVGDMPKTTKIRR